jgi:hypothetical protein
MDEKPNYSGIVLIEPPAEYRKVRYINLTWLNGHVMAITSGCKSGEKIEVQMTQAWYRDPVAYATSWSNWLGIAISALRVPDEKVDTNWPIGISVWGPINEGPYKTGPTECVRIDSNQMVNYRQGIHNGTPYERR